MEAMDAPEPVELCGGCETELRPDDWIELCIWCEGPLCKDCWEEFGYCGPSVHQAWAAPMVEFQDPATTDARRAEIMRAPGRIGNVNNPRRKH